MSARTAIRCGPKGDATLIELPIGEDGSSQAIAASRSRAAGLGSDVLGTILSSLDDAKAEDTISIDIAGKSALGDHMVVTSGRSHRHVNAIADRLVKDLKGSGFGPIRIEGLPHCDWVLIDAGDIIVHVFRPEVREFYNLEKMWSAEPYSERRAQA